MADPPSSWTASPAADPAKSWEMKAAGIQPAIADISVTGFARTIVAWDSAYGVTIAQMVQGDSWTASPSSDPAKSWTEVP